MYITINIYTFMRDLKVYDAHMHKICKISKVKKMYLLPMSLHL